MSVRSPKALLLLLTVLAFSSPSSARAEDVDYSPLEVGLVWTADVKATAADGRTLLGTAKREITGTENIRGKSYFVTRTTVEGIPGFHPFITYRRKDKDGVYSIKEDDPSRTEVLETPLPLVKGRAWEISSSEGATQHRVEGIESVTLRGVVFANCVRITSRAANQSYTSEYYLAPGIGNVTETIRSGEVILVFVHTDLSGQKETPPPGPRPSAS